MRKLTMDNGRVLDAEAVACPECGREVVPNDLGRCTCVECGEGWTV